MINDGSVRCEAGNETVSRRYDPRKTSESKRLIICVGRSTRYWGKRNWYIIENSNVSD